MTEIKQLITVENDNLQDIKVDQTVICDGKFYSQIAPKFSTKIEDKKLDSVYQYPHIFYPFTEDIDYSSILSNVKNITHKGNVAMPLDKYTDDDAETQYLLSVPMSYIILGKPEIGQVEIATLLSDTWQCVNINPLQLINDELKSESRAGKCIGYNLEAGRAVEPEIVLRLMEKRVNSEAVQHRGAIINGFPLVANSNYQEDIISSESAIFNIQDIFDESVPAYLFTTNVVSVVSVARQVSQVDEQNTVSEAEETVVGNKSEVAYDSQEENGVTTKKSNQTEYFGDKKKNVVMDVGPSAVNINNNNNNTAPKTDKYNNLASPEKQLDFIFKLFENKPLIIIYINCDNIDAVRKRQNYRFHVSKQVEFPINPSTYEIIDNTTHSNSSDLKNAGDYNMTFNIEIGGTDLKQIVKLPYNFRVPISSQLVQYRDSVKPVIDNRILYCNPEHFIKCDGRLPNIRMFNSINTRLKTLGFQYVLIPERIKLDEKEFATHEGMDSLENISSVNGNKVEESFKNLRENKLCGSMYKYGLSNWGYKCPVALKEGRIVTGKAEFAVKFMSKIYFLSDENALLKFCKNPRQILLPTLPNPTCRIWIYGPKQSGKSAIAKCLSYLFNCKILNLDELEIKYESAKCFDYVEKLRTAAITEALVTINNNRKLERQETIDEWTREAQALLSRIIEFNTATDETEVSTISVESDAIDSVENFDFKLKTLNLPPYSEKYIFKTLLDNENELLKYLPEIFSRPIEPATVFDQFVKSYVKTAINDAIMPDMTLTFDEKVDMIKNEIQETEDEYYQVNKTRGGWIIDGMFADSDLLEKICPEYLADDIICLIDTDVEHKFLIEKHLQRRYSSNDFSSFFKKIKRFSLSEKTKDLTMRNHSRLYAINNVLNDKDTDEIIVNRKSSKYIEAHLANSVVNAESYMASLNEYHLKWGLIKIYLETVQKASLIEINIERKSMQDLLKDAVISIENKYRMLAYAMSEDDVKEEMIDFGDKIALFDNESVQSGIEEEEGQQKVQEPNLFEINRRLGTTNVYCPVVFDRYFVLWKGNDLYPASFAQSVYHLSSESALKEFIADPRVFLNREPPKSVPPPRICFIGTAGSGKTSCAKVLADNYGLHYINFDHLLLQAFNLPLDDLNYIITVNPIIDEDMQLNGDKLLIIKSYLENDVPLDKNIVKQILTPLWFQEPYVNVGFVLDNFPRRPSDVQCMIENFFIPDILIELYVDIDFAINRKYPLFTAKRKREIAKCNEIMQEEYEMKFSKWQEDRYLRLQQLLEEKWDRFQKKNEINVSTQKLTTPVASEPSISTVMDEGREVVLEPEERYIEYDELQQKQDLDEANEILDKEMPMPIFTIELQTEQEISDSLHTLIETNYWRDLDFFEYIKTHCHDANIMHTTVKTNKKTAENVFYEILRLTDQIKFRNRSFFERVYAIDVQVAEKLLNQGYYFMSRFGRTCPVQRYENKNPIQMYLQHENSNIFPLIYHRYIYFLYTAVSRDKFMNDPVKYTTANLKSFFPMIPAKVAIIGPPKAGKSTLAQRLEQEYNLKIITRGSAIRYVLETFPKCYLAENIKKVIDAGWSVTFEMSAKAVQALTLDERSISQGYILDGFPQTDEEMKQLVMLGIVPYVILDIRVTKSMIYQNLASLNTAKPFRTYSERYIDSVYYRWERNAYEFRQWLYDNYQNVKTIENEKCKWHLCKQAKPHIMSTMLQLHEYLYKKNFDNAINLRALCITPQEFVDRQSGYYMLCPLCWYFSNILQDGGPFPDRRNVIQYLNFYYYVCDMHISQFCSDPTNFVPPRNLKLLPLILPTFIEHNKKNLYYEDGLCITCFWDNQPKRVLKEGSNKFVIKYKDDYYRFCSENCAKIFFRQPNKYNTLVINFKDKNKPKLGALSKLPTLGYLEQLAGQLVTDAVINTEIERPYLAGLSIAQSAALHMGMYLKINNPNATKESVQLYKEAKEKYDYRRDKLKRKIEHFKSRINPFISINNMRTARYKFGSRSMYEDNDDFSVYSKLDAGSPYPDSYQYGQFPYEGYEYEYEEE